MSSPRGALLPSLGRARLAAALGFPVLVAAGLMAGGGEGRTLVLLLAVTALALTSVLGGIPGILFLAFPFGPKAAFGPGNVYLGTILVLGAIACWFLAILHRRGRMRPLPGRLMAPLAVLLGILTISALHHMGDLYERPADLLRIVQLLAYLLLLPLAYDLAPSRSRLRFLLLLPLALGVAEAVYALWWAPPGPRGFLVGTFDHEHNNFAAEMLLAFALGLGILSTHRGLWGRTAVAACLALVGAALLLSQSRAAAVATVVGVLSLMALPLPRPWRGLLLLSLAAAALAGWLVFPAELKERLFTIAGSLFRGEHDPALSRRLTMWREGWWAWRAHPIWGTGVWSRPLMDNYFLKVAAELGLVGLASLLWLLLAVARESWRLACASLRSGASSVAPGFWMAAVALLFIMNLSGDYFLLHRVMGSFWLLLGLLLRMEEQAGRVLSPVT